MIPIDPSMFPRLSTRKALIVVDAQNDFLSKSGALPVRLPVDLTERVIQLVNDFRPHGDVVWVRSEYERARPANHEAILTSDSPIAGRRPMPRGRRSQETPQDQGVSSCQEAFLSGTTGSHCVRKGTPGAQFPPTIEEIVDRSKDITFVKSHYSAFKSQELMQRLRMRFVTEIYICGSLTNIGVQATVNDAASHGLDITIIEDCCGYRSAMRHSSALKQMRNTAGSEVMSSREVMDLLRPKEKPSKSPEPKTAGSAKYLTVRQSNSVDAASSPSSSSPSSDLNSSFARLSLSSEAAAALQPDSQARAKTGKLPLHPVLEKLLQPEEKRVSKSNGRPQAENGLSSSDPRDESRSDRPTATAWGKAIQPHVTGDTNKGEREVVVSDVAKDKDDNKVEPNHSESDCAKKVADSKKVSEPSAAPPEHVNPSTEDQGRKENPKDQEHSPDTEKASKPEAADMEPKNEAPSHSEPLCEGDTKVINNVLPHPLSENIFKRMRDEVQWQRMSHQGGEVPRLVAVQGDVDEDGTFPIYRHPADESPPLLPWSATVREIKDTVEKVVGHTLNHALIQFYRDGNDYISEHSDKTLDIAKDSFIVNVSLGAERTMCLRTKRDPSSAKGLKRDIVRTPLPHNSMCQMGLKTNMRWLHSIRQDKRMDRDKNEAELAFGGQRISLTFRKIGTFLDREGVRIWGQGAKAKTPDEAHQVINGETEEAVGMLQAFGRENRSSDFDWEESYGCGFDVLHMSVSSRLFLSVDDVVNMRIQFMLAEYGVTYARGSMTPPGGAKEKAGKGDEQADRTIPADLPIKFVDNDPAKSTVQGDIAIMMYLSRVYGSRENTAAADDFARCFTRFQRGLALLDKARAVSDLKELKRELAVWDGFAAEAEFIACSSVGLADSAVWPVLHGIARERGDDSLFGFENLAAYYKRVLERCLAKTVPGVTSMSLRLATSEGAEGVKGEQTTPSK